MQPGTRLGPYEIVRPLGAGGMGEVYLARDPRLGREVALKVLPAAFSTDAVRRRRFEEEARTVAALNHPHVVTLYSIEAVDGIEFLTMEFIDGETLDREIAGGGVSVARFLEIARPLAAAVAAAHRRGVVHRDLKPANVMIDREGFLKVLDFGIAAQEAFGPSGEDAATRTATAGIVGTVAYMSPERLTGRASGPAADVFSLGVLFHELLSGTRPFAGSSPAELASSILRDDPPPLGAPPLISRIVARCLAKDANERFASAVELVEALERIDLAAEGTAPLGVTVAPRSVAVGSFVNLGGDPATDWLGIGLAETLTIELRRVAGLTVVGRDRTLARTAEAEGEPRRLGALLGSVFVVAGSYQVSAGALRVIAELHATDPPRCLAAIKVDGTQAELFALQDRLVGEIVAALDAELSGTGLAPRARVDSSVAAAKGSLDAFELYARGREQVFAMTPSAFTRAGELFERAIQASPSWALPHGGLGQLRAMRFIASTDRADLERAVEHLRRALTLDPRFVEAMTWLTYALWRQGRYDEAEATGTRAVELDPGEPHAHYFLGVLRLGRSDDPGDRSWLRRSLGPIEECVRLAPRYAPGQLLLGIARIKLGRYEEAVAPIEAAAAIERSPRSELARFVGAGPARALIALRTGNLGEAVERAERALEELAGNDHVYATVGRLSALRTAAEAYLRAGRAGEAAARLHRVREQVRGQESVLGAGWLVARADALSAWALRELGLRSEATRALARAERGLARDNGFDFGWHWEGGLAVLQVDLALAAAAQDRQDEGARWLQAAAVRGWADARRLESDPLFAGVRALAGYESLRQTVAG